MYLSVAIHLFFFQLTCSSCCLAHFSNSQLGWNDIFKTQIEEKHCSLQGGRLVFSGVRARCRPDSYIHPQMSCVFIYLYTFSHTFNGSWFFPLFLCPKSQDTDQQSHIFIRQRIIYIKLAMVSFGVRAASIRSGTMLWLSSTAHEGNSSVISVFWSIIHH